MFYRFLYATKIVISFKKENTARERQAVFRLLFKFGRMYSGL